MAEATPRCGNWSHLAVATLQCSRAASPFLVCVLSRWWGREEGVSMWSAWGFECGARGW